MTRKVTKREKFRNVCEEVNDNFLDYDEPLDEAYSEIINLEIGEVYLLHHEDDDVFLAFEREAYCLWIWNVDWAEFWHRGKWHEVLESGRYKEDNLITYRCSNTSLNNREIKNFYKKKEAIKRKEYVPRFTNTEPQEYIFPEQKED
jgi:hypothetical protein